MKIYIDSKKPVHEGAGVSVKLRLESETGESAGADIVISFDDYSVLCEYIRPGEISEEFFSVLEEKGRIYSAYSYGMYLLGFGECSRKKLVYKLEKRGHDRESACRAADMLAEAGYIDEYELVHSAMLHACHDKCYGRRRIIAELYEKGFDRETFEVSMEIDFAPKASSEFSYERSFESSRYYRLSDGKIISYSESEASREGYAPAISTKSNIYIAGYKITD